MNNQQLADTSRGDASTGLAPAPARVKMLDAKLRLRLAESLDYVGEYVLANLGIEFRQLAAIKESLRQGAVSAWTFCLFSKLVAELSKGAPVDVVGLLEAVGAAASLPPAEGLVPFGSRHPQSWWEHFQVLTDTDANRALRLEPPSPHALQACEREVGAAFALMQRADPELRAETADLLRTILLASPAPSIAPFDGSSTFFNWGATLINGDIRRNAIEVVDLLVHESSHLLLFALSSQSALTKNAGTERYSSPVRSDPRPIDGIFHACFVTSRVHLAMKRLIGSGRLSAEEMAAARRSLVHNGHAAQESLDLLKRHAELTSAGEAILAELDEYWMHEDHPSGGDGGRDSRARNDRCLTELAQW